ncbi:MAG: aldolase/citrate lyase family protein [bacterium]|nr:aldolase/citrate lyase family protein [bacterium]
MDSRRNLKRKLRNREKIFGAWVSFAHPSITEIFVHIGVDFLAIDMEHSTIDQAQAQRIIAACQGQGVPCLPRSVSHGNEMIKPLLDSGADGMIVPMVSTLEELNQITALCKFPSQGKRSFGVSRAQGYGFYFDEYVKTWNETSSLVIQIESQDGVKNIEKLVAHDAVDGVMIGPYDLSGSLGVPGQIHHPLVAGAAEKVIKVCARYGKACGTHLVDVDQQSIEQAFTSGYTFVILSSDLFVLWKWGERTRELIVQYKKSLQ